MIIGNGLLARAFSARYATRNDVLIFASGVANSLETSDRQFERERNALVKAMASHQGKLVYFGSCSIADHDRQATPYARHKLGMEELVLSRPGGLVLRLPQVVGHTDNPHTLTNFLHHKIMHGEEFCVWGNAERNLIDADDVAAIGAIAVERLPISESGSMTIASRRSIPMLELVAAFERVLGRKASFHVAPRGAPLPIDAREACTMASSLDIDLGSDYVERILRKYYGNDA